VPFLGALLPFLVVCGPLYGYNDFVPKISGVEMIKNFKDGETGDLCRFYKDNQRGASIPALLEGALRRKLVMIEAASEERALFTPRSNNYERLSGNLEGWSSIRVNIQYRIIFQWREGAAHDVYLDAHTYR